MSDRERKVAVAVCAAVLAAVVAVLSLTRDHAKPARQVAPPRTAPAPAPVARPETPAADPPTDATASDDSPTGALPAGQAPEPGVGPPAEKPGPAVVVAAARRFIDAYLVYELGRPDAAQRGAIARTTADPLRTALLRTPPRAPIGSPLRPARLRWIDVVTPYRGGGPARYDVSFIVRRGGADEAHVVTIAKEAGRWLVTDLRA